MALTQISNGDSGLTARTLINACFTTVDAASTGGNGTTDSGKLAKFNAWGGLDLGSASNNGGTPGLVIKAGTANGLLIESSGIGAQAVDIQLNGVSGQAYSIHSAAASTTGVLYDGSGDTGTGTGARLSTNGAGLLVCNVDDNDKFGIQGSTGNLEWYGSATTPFSGANKTVLTAATPSGISTITFPATTGTVVTTAGGTLTGQVIQSTAGAASTPPLALTGAFFTGGSATTTKPQFLIEPTGTTSTGWSTSGTGFGVNAASAFVGRLADFQLNGASKANIDYQGNVNAAGLASLGTSLPLGTQNFTGGALLTLFNIDVGFGSARTTFYDSNAYFSGGYQIQFANSRAGAADCGLKWGAAGTVKVTNASTGYAAIDASAFKVSGTAGASFGPGLPTSITVVNGIITAIS